MNDNQDEELIGNGLEYWFDLEKTHWNTVKVLLQYCLISSYKFELEKNELQYLHISDSGIKYLNGEKLIYHIVDKNDYKKLIYSERFH